ncbi:transglutaminase-like domain-containing protein, partial [Nocardiopsis metallicus]
DRPVGLRWVALADFTGTTWLPESGYRNAGQILPEPVPPPPGAELVSAHVTVGEELPGSWAPVVGAPREVGLDPLGYDALTGTVVTLDGDVAGRSYETVGEVADWSGVDPARSAPPVGDVYDLYRDLPPGAPPIINEVVTEIAAEGDYYDRARALADYLRESHTFDPTTPGGHGYAHIDALLAAPGGRGGGGTSEQFASAFTMLARAAGLPSRVAVGFAPGTERTEGEYEVTTGDAYAWGEVYFDGLGWVPFHVTPGGQDDTAAGQSPADENDSEDPETEELESSSAAEAAEGTATERADSDHGAWIWAGAASGGTFALILLVPALRLTRRALRLGSGDPTERVLGAWREMREALRLGSAVLSAGDTVTDTVAVARSLAPPPTLDAGLDRLAAAVNGAGFGGGSGIDAGAADEAGRVVRAHQRILRRGRPRLARLIWWFDPRPLFWRDGPRTGRQRRGRR